MKQGKKVFEKLEVKAVTETERKGVEAIYKAGHKFIDDIFDILWSDEPNPVKEKIEIARFDLFKVIRDERISIHPIIYAEIKEFTENVFEQPSSNNPVIEYLETHDDWIKAIQNLRKNFEEFADLVIMPYLWS